MYTVRNIFLVLLFLMQAAALYLLAQLVFSPKQQNIQTENNHQQQSFSLLSDFTQANSATPSSTSESPTLTEEKLRTIIRSELAMHMKKADTGKTEMKVLTQEEVKLQQKAASESGTLVQNALAARQWTRENSEAIMPHVVLLSQQQREALLNELYNAVNRQELELKDVPPL